MKSTIILFITFTIIQTTVLGAKSFKEFFHNFTPQESIIYETSLSDNEKLTKLDKNIKNYLSQLEKGAIYNRTGKNIKISVDKKTLAVIKNDFSKKHSFYLLEEDKKAIEISTNLINNTKNLPDNIKVIKSSYSFYHTQKDIKDLSKKAPKLMSVKSFAKEKEDVGIINDYYFKINLPQKSEEEFKTFISSLKVPEGYKVYYSKVIDFKNPYLRTYVLKNEIKLTEDSIQEIKILIDTVIDRPYISVTLNNSAKYLFEEITNRLTGHRLAIIFDDVILNAPVIQEKISGGIFSITLGYGNYSKTKQRAEQEVEEFSKNLILSTFTKFLTLKE